MGQSTLRVAPRQQRLKVGRLAILRLDLSASFLRCKFRGMRPAIASTPCEGEDLNVPVIHNAAFLCIRASRTRRFLMGALFTHHSLKPFVVTYSP